MAEWVYIENNEILEYHDKLPNNWRNISGLNLSANNTEWLKSLGWFPIQKTAEVLGQHVSHYDYQILDDYVIETPVYQIFSDEEKIEMARHEFNVFLSQVRQHRNHLLLESDYTQLADVMLLQTEIEKKSWKLYRQALRDFPSTINEVCDLNWPSFTTFYQQVLATENVPN